MAKVLEHWKISLSLPYISCLPPLLKTKLSFIFQSSFIYMANLSWSLWVWVQGPCGNPVYFQLSFAGINFSTLNIPHQSSPFATKGASIDTSLSLKVHGLHRTHSWSCAFYGYWLVHRDMSPPVQYLTENVTVLRSCVLHPSPQTSWKPLICPHSSISSRSLCTWNHITCSLFRLAFFT